MVVPRAGAPREKENPEPDDEPDGALAIGAGVTGAAGVAKLNGDFVVSGTAGGVAGAAPNENGVFAASCLGCSEGLADWPKEKGAVVAPDLGSSTDLAGWPKENGAVGAPNGSFGAFESAEGVPAVVVVTEGVSKVNAGFGASATGAEADEGKAVVAAVGIVTSGGGLVDGFAAGPSCASTPLT